MQLAIEPEDATTSSRRGSGGAARVDGGVVSLGITVPAQERAHWCWAAIAVGLERYYGRAEHDQAALARAVLGDDAPDGELDRDVGLDRALAAAGCYSHWSPGKPTLARVRFEINLGRPLAARIEWDGGVGHYVLVTGYDLAGDGLFIDDPRRGPARIGFAEFPRGYDRGGTWTESFWTTHPLTTSVEP